MRPQRDGLRATTPKRMYHAYMNKGRLLLIFVVSYSLANKLYLKVADLAAIEGEYYKSIEQYERVAKTSINNNLMKWSVKDYFLKAGMCHLASNVRNHRSLKEALQI